MRIFLNSENIVSLGKLRDNYCIERKIKKILIKDFIKNQYNCELDLFPYCLYGEEEEEDITHLLLKL